MSFYLQTQTGLSSGWKEKSATHMKYHVWIKFRKMKKNNVRHLKWKIKTYKAMIWGGTATWRRLTSINYQRVHFGFVHMMQTHLNFFPSCLLTTNIYKNRYFFSLVGKDSLANAEKKTRLLDATAEEFKAGNKKKIRPWKHLCKKKILWFYMTPFKKDSLEIHRLAFAARKKTLELISGLNATC